MIGKENKTGKSKVKKYFPYSFLLAIGFLLDLYFVAIFDSTLRKQRLDSLSPDEIIVYVASSNNAWKLFFLLAVGIVMAVIILILTDSKDYQSDQILVTPKISTPVPAGQGQCGTAKWLPKEDYDRVFGTFEVDSNAELMKMIEEASLNDIKKELHRIETLEKEIDQIKELIKNAEKPNPKDIEKLQLKQHELEDENNFIHEVTHPEAYDDIKKKIRKGGYTFPSDAGIVLGKKDKKDVKELLYYIYEDVHTLVLGATRSGKGRTVLLQTIAALIFAAESMIITDPKTETYYYYKKLLELFEYNTVVLDFKNPRKSSRFNFLQPIINCVDAGDLPGAIEATWDLVSQLVGEPKGERLWSDGEASTIAAATIAVVYDNRSPENHKYRNLTNVYYFLSQMCTPIQVGKEMVLPLTRYVKDLPDDHPAKGLLAVADIAPSRTRGSFYTSALMTLRLFTNPLIADMTSTTDFDPMTIGRDKTAIFIVLPEDRRTYNSLASLFVSQIYQLQSKAADKRGGRLERRTNYLLDEYGNYAKITNFTSMQTVGGGKGMRFNIFVQDYNQIDDVYEKIQGSIIRSNCENWIYLQTDDPDTLEGLSKKLGKYTISTYSLSANHQKYSTPSSSHSIQLTGRELLTSDEIKRINRPYSLVTSRNDPAIMYAPDLSQWYFNRMLGLGDKEHNRRLRAARENLRPSRKVSSELVLWGIWNEYKSAMINEQKEKEEKAMQRMAEQYMAGHF
ncbi:hypothetical protein acsn021_11020 [Anaerocolumna cellulosilytica]|uniref:Uncharacterized protein n=1 Tax=Anaerocolumna cellulosilytica TaxID=433286 RepID=A0A6S6QQC3_9FIRM|nr:type IV secretory system conjugative DNA transfer family protein [Anaerocolumna cellulosilytica]MBB5194589.1 type IV secretion system protein VirD4 [Anaerocolumna cellulosilytica]BCJ93533.1 hypothetical protein acsn021_11020 [Anaerocolumna cellulosilytica]